MGEVFLLFCQGEVGNGELCGWVDVWGGEIVENGVVFGS